MAPMCQYSAAGGVATDWHLAHLGARAAGGAALVMVEASAVSPEGRISPADLGIWSDEQGQALARIARFIREQGAMPAIQIAHAGRKASTDLPWRSGKPLPPDGGGWLPVAPSPLAFDAGYSVPAELGEADLERIRVRFAEAAQRADKAGFEVLEIHMAHGYLLHEFLSPLSNRRADRYGGSEDNRMRFPLAVAAAVRAEWPAHRPLFVRISATDWVEGGWDLAQSVGLCRKLKALGVDLIDCSSGGLAAQAPVPVAPGYQAPFAQTIRREAQLPTGAVGLITTAPQAERIIADGQADAVFLGRELLRNPYWPLFAARELGADISWPPQYLRAKP